MYSIKHTWKYNGDVHVAKDCRVDSHGRSGESGDGTCELGSLAKCSCSLFVECETPVNEDAKVFVRLHWVELMSCNGEREVAVLVGSSSC